MDVIVAVDDVVLAYERAKQRQVEQGGFAAGHARS